ncbi:MULTISPECIES: GNAT family N-acetyltransferase [unclassified Dysgonomonas]|uniref:GNAT family N-acetyltransferase n=1 Tax=unclassified Dysgonomonas TaxID=2630389 RepID=UPI0013ED67F6|nr:MULTISPECIES: N-acetyltransferase [unclassified Dysgonomonas]
MKNNSITVEIRQEDATDFPAVYNINSTAFEGRDEAQLVDRLRGSENFIPELSLVATIENKLVGHILFTTIKIVNEETETESLALAPIAVKPELQRKGIGTQLIQHGLKKAKELGYESAIVLGHEHYYPRFGFAPTNKWGIKAPFNVPANVFMAVELVKDALSGVRGTVKYDKAFEEV